MPEFNLTTYRRLLEEAQTAGYRFCGFDQLRSDSDSIKANGGVILLRHDIDADLSAASMMASLEADLGVTSTYFLMWRSPLYNLFSRSSYYHVEQILSVGHKIGLHYDHGFDEVVLGASSEESEKRIIEEVDLIESNFDCSVDAVSFHQPAPRLLQSSLSCAGRVNTYDFRRLKNFRYVSDSNRTFKLWENSDAKTKNDPRSGAIAACFPENLQILIHPLWWVYDKLTTNEVWNSAIESNFDQSQRQLLMTERAFGKKRTLSIVESTDNEFEDG